MRYFSITFLLFLICSSCGYHAGSGSSLVKYKSLSIPYIENDVDGLLTNEIIQQVNQSLPITFVNSGGDISLLVKLENLGNESIGYRRDREKDNGEVKRHIIASEGRRLVTVSISVLDNATNKLVMEPCRVKSYTDYDYVDQNSLTDLSFINTQGQRETVLRFSLGQLEPVDSAQEAAKLPLFRSCAQKIIDVISSEW